MSKRIEQLVDLFYDLLGAHEVIGQVLDAVEVKYVAKRLADEVVAALAPVLDEPAEPSYTVAQIRAAFADHATVDEWGIESFYEYDLLAALEQCDPEHPHG